jgi:hypothetical protein
LSIPHLKVFEIENGYPKYWISACKAIWHSGIIIMAVVCFLFATNLIAQAQQRYPAFGNLFRQKTQNNIESNHSIKIECMQLSFQ